MTLSALFVCFPLIPTVYTDNPGPFFRDTYDWVGDQQSKIIIFDKATGDYVAEIETEAFFITHQVHLLPSCCRTVTKLKVCLPEKA